MAMSIKICSRFFCERCVVFLLFCFVNFSNIYTAPTFSPLQQFLKDVNRNNCHLPKEIEPFNATSRGWDFLSSPLKQCGDSTANFETRTLCHEIFENLKNTTCHLNLSSNIMSNVHFSLSTDVCSDFANFEYNITKVKNYVGGKLADNMFCKFSCDENFEIMCKILLWTYQVRQHVENALKHQNARKVQNEVESGKSNPSNDLASKIFEDQKRLLPVPLLTNSGAEADLLVKEKQPVTQSQTDIKPASENKQLAKQNNENENNQLSDQQDANQAQSFEKEKTVQKNSVDKELYKISPNSLLNEVKKTNKDKVAFHNMTDSHSTHNQGILLIQDQNTNFTASPRIKVSKEDKNLQKQLETNTVSDDQTKSAVKNLEDDNKDIIFDINFHQNNNSNHENTVTSIDTKNRFSKGHVDNSIENYDNGLPPDTNSKRPDMQYNLTRNEKVVAEDNLKEKNVLQLNEQNIIPNPIDKQKNDAESGNINQIPSAVANEKIPTQNLDEDNKPKTVVDSQINENNVPSNTMTATVTQRTPDATLDETVNKPKLEKMDEANEIPAPVPERDQYTDLENEGDLQGEYERPDYAPDGILNTPDETKTAISESFNPTSEKTSESKISDMTMDMSKLYDDILPRNLEGMLSDESRRIPPFPEEEDGHFFFYFLSIVFILMTGYLLFHNKQKIIALIVEGRHERRRRSHGAGYKKLETK